MMQWAEDTIQDLGYTLRGWRRSPGFAIAAIATLALGIGANTAIFSVVSGVLLRPLPFAHPEGLVRVYETQPRDRFLRSPEGPVTYADFEEWRSHTRLFEGMITYTNSSRNLQGDGEPEQVATLAAERGLFGLLGVAALAGRTFREGDPLNVVVASYVFWKGHFGGDPSAVGRSLTLDGEPFTLLGAMPEGFQFPHGSSSPELWVPWDARAALGNRPTGRLDAVVGRLKPGVALEAARQELSAMEGPTQGGRQARIRPLKDVVSGPARESLLVLLGAVGMVLLVACVNVANLLLARTASRGREIAIRAALGAGRSRLMRQFLTESLLLALGGGAAGLAIGMWGSRALLRIAAEQIPRAGEIGLDWRVFAFLLAVCVATGIGSGLAPAMAAARGGSSALKSPHVRSAFRDALVVVEVAMAFVLLAGAGLLLRTFLNLQRTDTGLNADNALTVHIVVSDARESTAIEERVARIPGVRAAGLISLLPLQNSGWYGGVTIAGRPAALPTELRYVTPGYFRAMGIPLRRGREFSPRDGPGVPRVILVNEALARQYFPNEDPVGRATDRGTIIGVVGDVRQDMLSLPARPEIYYTLAQNFAQLRRHGSTLVVRGTGPVEALVGAIRAAVREVSPGQALFRVATMRQVIEESLATQRLYTWLLGLFAALGALLAAAGIYGVIAYLVALRTREFGIRMALGAGAGRVLRLVMKRGALLVALGLALGIGGAAAITRVLRGLLYGVAATDPATFGAMAALLAAVALAACLAPARRAARVDPSVALRSE
ncbi:MAG: ABC transporter permease [Acidobacteria bacterium]|nr:ABC transporter permease [Acidobacteriota bacterium]